MSFARILGLVISGCWGLMTLVAISAQAALTAIGPLPYLSAADSPFVNDPSLVTVLEDFEDGALNVPGISNRATSRTPPAPNDGRGIVLPPGGLTDSVDGDDGAIDGFGNGGHSFQSTDFSVAITFPASFYSILILDFQPLRSGQYPTAFGFAWTDGEPESYVLMSVRDANSFSAGTVGFPVSFGDDVFAGETADDRFIGVRSTMGIERVVIESFYFARSETDNGAGRQQAFELDHLQFSYPQIPEPSAATFILVGTAVSFLLRRTLCAR